MGRNGTGPIRSGPVVFHKSADILRASQPLKVRRRDRLGVLLHEYERAT
jgi:hypothetical protein